MPRLLTRKQFRALPYIDAALPWRRLASAVLLTACTDAHAGDVEAGEWVQHSHQARQWADLIDLPAWPPRPDQLGSKGQLGKRAYQRTAPPRPTADHFRGNESELAEPAPDAPAFFELASLRVSVPG